MGERFLHQAKEKKPMEEIGVEHFLELLARSFFQQSNCRSSKFVMHDLINDLTRFVVGDVFLNLEDKLEDTIYKKNSSFIFYLSNL